MAATFNASLLLLARQYRGRSQAEVATAAGLNQGHYSRIENGLMPEGPSVENVERIAEVLDFPSSFFFLQDGLAGLPLSVHPMNRRKTAVGERAMKQIHAELNIRLIHLRRYLRAADIHPELPLLSLDVDEGGGPQAIAQTLRKAWSIPEGPIPNLTDYCERAGILVIWCDLEKGVDGVTMSVRDLPPCIFLNQHVPADRMRFSLAHELGHIIMHTVPSDEIENEANAFAAELLVPEKQFRRSLIGQRLTLEWLARQKAYWRASMGSLLYRAGEIGAVTRHQTEYLWRRLSASGWRTREPQETDFPHEIPTVFPKLVRMHGEDLAYDLVGLQELLSANTNDLVRMYRPYLGTKHRGLLVVK